MLLREQTMIKNLLQVLNDAKQEVIDLKVLIDLMASYAESHSF